MQDDTVPLESDPFGESQFSTNHLNHIIHRYIVNLFTYSSPATVRMAEWICLHYHNIAVDVVTRDSQRDCTATLPHNDRREFNNASATR